jgi:hypothetical protein
MLPFLVFRFGKPETAAQWIGHMVVLQVSNAGKFVGERLWCVLKLPNRKDYR